MLISCSVHENSSFGCSLLLVIADILNAMLIRATGQSLQKAYAQHLEALDLFKLTEESGNFVSLESNN